MHSQILLTVAALTVGMNFICRASETMQNNSIAQLPYPAEVSLVQEPTGWTFRQSPSDLPLYLYEPDSPLESNCDHACARQWIPLLARTDEEPLGYWTILMRKDGRRQWEFEHHPVYTHLHESPDTPTGVGADRAWRLMPHFSAD